MNQSETHLHSGRPAQCTLPPQPISQTLFSIFLRVWFRDYLYPGLLSQIFLQLWGKSGKKSWEPCCCAYCIDFSIKSKHPSLCESTEW